MKISVFVGISLDGFIARKNHSFDFLPTEGGDPKLYNDFMASVDAIVIGRNTFDVVLGMPGWPYGKRRVVVLTSCAIDHSKVRGKIEVMSGNPRQIVSQMAASGANHLYVDGGATVQRFLREGLVTHLCITRVPVLIGEGIPLFGPVPQDVKLKHLSTRTFNGGLVTSEYEVLK